MTHKKSQAAGLDSHLEKELVLTLALDGLKKDLERRIQEAKAKGVEAKAKGVEAKITEAQPKH